MRPSPRPWIRAIRPYSPGGHEAVEAGRLASNESPFEVDEAVVAAVGVAARGLNRYPDPYADELRSAIAARHEVAPEQVLVGNGSDELIFLLTWAFAAGDGAIVCADPAYQLDVLAAAVAGARVHRVPLLDWAHDLGAMAEVAAQLAYVVNPHNPTGTAHDLGAIRDFVARSRADIVVVDEAYIDFAAVDSAMPLARDGEALVLRTMSKVHGIAGARVGYLVGPTEVLDVLRTIRSPFSVGTLAQAAALAALRSPRTRGRRDVIVHNRGRTEALLRDRGLEVVPSQANFVFVPDVDEALFVESARSAGVAIRPGSAVGAPGSVRISVPDDAGLPLLADAVERYAAARAGTPRS